MHIKKPEDVKSSQITDQKQYMNRRKFIVGTSAAGVALLGGWSLFGSSKAAPPPAKTLAALTGVRKSPFSTKEPMTSYKDITTYNNFYEFGTDKSSPSLYAGTLVTHPWSVSVEGEIKHPKVYGVDELMKLAPLEDRIYRLRCVEAWSMVIPWIGFSLNELIRRAEPNSRAKYVAFTTLYNPKEMPGQKSEILQWPYVEGLRLDEAMHPLTILCFGLYGKVLPNQDGAPVRIVVPWKYGFKSIKSLVKIRFVEKQPPTSWNRYAPNEYGFYSNVNPHVDHPRWSQARERRIGEFRKRPTLMFNGYGDQVARLYTGMDLRKYF